MSAKLLIGGGQEYHGPTAERDKRVVVATAKALFNKVGNDVTIVTGGMPGIPMDFAKAWLEAGGKHVQFIFSHEAHSKLTGDDIVMNVGYEIVAQTQKERRQYLTQMEDLKCAFFVQGGQYTTDEILKCIDRRLPTICFVGSGGAAGGEIEYEGRRFEPCLLRHPEWALSTDPDADPAELGEGFAERIAVFCKRD